MQRPPRPLDGPKDARRREHRHLRHHRVAAEERAAQQRPRGHARACRYDGWTAAMAMLDPHPALKAVSPQASPADMFLGDDFHHNGAFRLSYGFEYAFLTEATKENGELHLRPVRHLRLVSGAGAARQRPARVSQGQGAADVARLRRASQLRRVLAAAGDEAVPQARHRCPTLNVAGWWDQEDFYGPVTIYRALEKHDRVRPEHARRRALVPRRMEQRARTEDRRRSTSDRRPASTTARSIQAPFFARHLKDRGHVHARPRPRCSNRGATAGARSRRGRRTEAVTRSLYFRADGTLSFDAAGARPTASASTHS